jgi:hypothetical protein
MKKLFAHLVCFSLLVISLIACGGGGGGGGSTTNSGTGGGDSSTSSSGTGGGSSSPPAPTPTNANEVTIKGSFTGTNANTSILKRFYAFFQPAKAFALDPSKVSKILVFEAGGNSYKSFTVSNGAFSFNLTKGNPIAMIFVGTNNEYLGYLFLKNDIAFLPLSKLKGDIATVDLGTLSSSGLVVEPSNNPIGNEIPFTNDEITTFAQANGLFASIIKNPDVDNNGIIDFLEDKYFNPYLGYSLDLVGNYSGKVTPTLNLPVTIDSGRVYLSATLPGAPDYDPNPICVGPPDSGFETGKATDDDPRPVRVSNVTSASHSVLFLFPGIKAPKLPPAGEYRIYYKGTKYFSFNIPDQSNAPSRILIIRPSVSLNENGTMKKFTWSYMSPASSAELNFQDITKNLMIMLDGKGTPCADHNEIGSGNIYTSRSISSGSSEHVLTCQDLLWENINVVVAQYNDSFNNYYVMGWQK